MKSNNMKVCLISEILLAFLIIPIAPLPALAAAKPDINYVQVNGTTVQPSGTITLNSFTLGSTFRFKIEVKNNGDDSPAGYNNITVSFPRFVNSSDKSFVSAYSRTSDLTYNEYWGSEATGGDAYADYTMVESSSTTVWDGNDGLWSESKYLELTVQPKQMGEFLIYYRAAMSNQQNWGAVIYNPASSGTTDCIGFPAYYIRVILQGPPDLTYSQPQGWSYPLVVSSSSGTNSDNSISVGNTSYIDYSITNNGDSPTGSSFRVELWDDTTGERIWDTWEAALNGNTVRNKLDIPWVFTKAGYHQLRLSIDTGSSVTESSETNNKYQRNRYLSNFLVEEKEIPGASQNPSSVPTYRNDEGFYPIPGYSPGQGICFATSIADILGYWDRNAYNGIRYWNLISNGTAPLLQSVMPASPGHDGANVANLIIDVGTRYYVQNPA
jgi:hypothetical protein